MAYRVRGRTRAGGKQAVWVLRGSENSLGALLACGEVEKGSPGCGKPVEVFQQGVEVTKGLLEKDDFGDGVEEGVMVSRRQVSERAISMSGNTQVGGMRVSAQQGKQRWRDAWSPWPLLREVLETEWMWEVEEQGVGASPRSSARGTCGYWCYQTDRGKRKRI